MAQMIIGKPLMILCGSKGKMKKVIFLLIFWMLSVPSIAVAAMTGKEVMEEQNRRQGVDTESTTEILLLVDKSGHKEKRVMKRYAKKMQNDLNRFLVVFLKPAAVKGTALLTWEQEGRDNDQWMFLPAQKKTKRIAKGSKKSYFMGTDFTYEDMEPEDIDNFTYTILRSEEIRKKDCWIIEAVPANKKKKLESSYAKRTLWVTKDTYFTLKIDFFDRQNHLIKTLSNHSVVNVQGTVWRPNKVLMNNIKKKHKTLVGIKSRKIDQVISKDLFTERYLLQGKHVQ